MTWRRFDMRKGMRKSTKAGWIAGSLTALVWGGIITQDVRENIDTRIAFID